MELLTLANLRSVMAKRLAVGPFISEIVVLDEMCKFMRHDYKQFDLNE